METTEYKGLTIKCGFCGKEMADDRSYYAYKTGNRRRHQYTYGDLIPVITVHSVRDCQEVKLCDDCKKYILEKVCSNIPNLKDCLLAASEWEIVHDKENRRRDSDFIRNLYEFKDMIGSDD